MHLSTSSRPGALLRRRLPGLAAVAVLLPALAACNADAGGAAGDVDPDRSGPAAAPHRAAEDTAAPPVSLTVNATARRPVSVDTHPRGLRRARVAEARHGRVRQRCAAPARGAGQGRELDGVGAPRARHRLPDRGDQCGRGRRDQALQRSFRTGPLTLDQQTYASIAPLEGRRSGSGMPVIVTFDVAGDRPRGDREAHVGAHDARAGGHLALDQRQRGALAAADLLAARHRRHGRRRHQRR